MWGRVCALIAMVSAAACAQDEGGASVPLSNEPLWAPAPKPMVAGSPNASSGGAATGSTGYGALGLPRCPKATGSARPTSACCYAPDEPGAPKCSWQRLETGQASAIGGTGFVDKMEAALPAGLILRGASPARLDSVEDCRKVPVGFVLAGPGLAERALSSSISHFAIKADGTWQNLGGGATSGLVAAENSTPGFTRDGGAPTPRYDLGAGLCDRLADAEVTALAELVVEIYSLEVDGVKYDTHFARKPNGEITGYFVIIEKGF